MEVARSNNFVIKYDKFDWNLHLTKVCLSRSSTSLRECMHPFSSLAFGCRVVDWSHAHARRRARRRRGSRSGSSRTTRSLTAQEETRHQQRWGRTKSSPRPCTNLAAAATRWPPKSTTSSSSSSSSSRGGRARQSTAPTAGSTVCQSAGSSVVLASRARVCRMRTSQWTGSCADSYLCSRLVLSPPPARPRPCCLDKHHCPKSRASAHSHGCGR